jgi:hypothetical protein
VRIQTICHSAFLCSSDGTNILVDPWIKDRVFMGGWALCPEPLPSVIDDLPPVQYIYLTHEHPDHFHPGSLKSLLSGPARGARLFIPKFMTSRFVDRLRATFPDTDVREMAHGRRYRADAISLWSYQYRNDDSSLVLCDNRGFTVVNSNDTFAKGRALAEIRGAHGQPDVLLNQFSISNAYPYGYADYPEAPDEFPWQQKDLAEYCVELVRFLQPKVWVPYHSFVEFCRPENAYLNKGKTSLDQICRLVGPHAGSTRVQAMYPGDVLEGVNHVPHSAGKLHFQSWATRPVPPAVGVSREQLAEAAAAFEQSFARVSRLFRRRVRPCGFTCSDDQEALLFDPIRSRFTFGDQALRAEHPTLGWTTTSRELLTRALRVPWGMADLLISGCMITQVPKEFRNADFVFWAVALVRHTGYLDLGSWWFLKPRAVATAFRRRAEALDIALSSVRAGGFTEGNLMPRKIGEQG